MQSWHPRYSIDREWYQALENQPLFFLMKFLHSVLQGTDLLRLIYHYSTTASRPLNTIVHRRDVWSLKAFRVPVQGTSTESVSCISKYHCCTIIKTWHGSAPFPQYCALRSLSMQLSLDHRKKLIEDTLPLYGKHVWEGFQITLPEIKSST